MLVNASGDDGKSRGRLLIMVIIESDIGSWGGQY